MVTPREMTTSRIKTALLLALSLGFVSIAVFLPSDGGDDSWRWLCGGFFSLCAVVTAIVLARPQRLILDADGFSLAGGLTQSPRHVRWRDVSGFFLYRLPRGGSVIAYNLTEQARPDTYMGDLARRLGADGTLPKTFPGKPEQIVAELNAYREAALTR